jgi:hypothetical protein
MTKKRNFQPSLQLNLSDKQDYLDNLYILENQLANGLINENQFDEKIEFLKNVFNERL